jgi:hypothetical protein
MNVTINGYDAVSDLNMAQQVGLNVALRLSFRLSAPSGRLNIKFTVSCPEHEVLKKHTFSKVATASSQHMEDGPNSKSKEWVFSQRNLS